jgi:hypothetical protein
MISNIVRSKKNCHVPESIESISFGPPESGSVIDCMTSIKNEFDKRSYFLVGIFEATEENSRSRRPGSVRQRFVFADLGVY